MNRVLVAGPFAGAALSALAANVAFGADIPVKAPIRPPETVAAWTGFYVGASVGVRASETRATVTNFDVGGDTLAERCAPPNSPLGDCVTSHPLRDSAFRFGLYGGYNLQLDRQWVVGVEADWGWANRTTTLNGMTYPAVALMSGRPTDTFSVKAMSLPKTISVRIDGAVRRGSVAR
jgi:outer membrane immunogenic protein